MTSKKNKDNLEFYLRFFIGLIFVFMILVFYTGYYHTLLDLATTPWERLGCWVLLFVVIVTLGKWAIKYGPQPVNYR